MTADDLERYIEARVGRGVWFVSRDVGGIVHGNSHTLDTLRVHGRVERRALAQVDPRRSTGAEYEYRLP